MHQNGHEFAGYLDSASAADFFNPILLVQRHRVYSVIYNSPWVCYLGYDHEMQK
jgi:hypothetical protein